MARDKIIMAAAFGALVAVSAAGAEPPATVVTAPDRQARIVRVSYADLDLSIRTDQHRLHRRVGAAASKVCWGNQPLLLDFAFLPCRRNAVRDARPQVAAAIDRAMRMQYSERRAPLPEIIVR